ncbi:MAG: hypothetical protein VX498_15280 [Myxococcota bacterium]|nr:hypothetical protein [Myxococcota bacterium]
MRTWLVIMPGEGHVESRDRNPYPPAMRSSALLALALPLLIPLAGCAGSTAESEEAGPASQAPPGFWAHWGDGRAELAGYRLTQPRYGEARRGEAVLITVTEDLTRASRVKSDGGHFDEFPVIKLNEVRDFGTGVYDYNVMTSTFLPLDGSGPLGLPTKISFSSQEWCGHVWEQFRIQDSATARTLHSYFDGEADMRETLVIPPGGVFGDAMPLLARGLAGELLSPGESRQVPWMRTSLQRRLGHHRSDWVAATIGRGSDPVQMEVPAGSFEVELWTASINGATSTWWIERAPPHRLVGWERSDGERGELLGSFRTAYWRQNNEGDEALRRKLGLN